MKKEYEPGTSLGFTCSICEQKRLDKDGMECISIMIRIRV